METITKEELIALMTSGDLEAIKAFFNPQGAHFLLQRAVIESNQLLDGADLRGAKLAGVDLSFLSFFGADFRGADLSGASLEGAKLVYADLRGANLTDANLEAADLVSADLTGAALKGVRFRAADLWTTQGLPAEVREAYIAELRASWDTPLLKPLH